MRLGFLGFASDELVEVEGDIGEERSDEVEEGLALSKLEKSESLSHDDDEGGVFGFNGELESDFGGGK